MKFLLNLLLGGSFLLLVACESKNEHYYKVHPQALQGALKECPKMSSPEVSCASLELIALEVNKLVFELQQNPQDFGQKIMMLQNEQTSLQQSIGSENKEVDGLVQQKQKTLQDELAMRLAVVKWLESPES